MENIYKIKDENGVVQYPITSEKAVNSSEGINIDSKFTELEDRIVSLENVTTDTFVSKIGENQVIMTDDDNNIIFKIDENGQLDVPSLAERLIPTIPTPTSPTEPSFLSDVYMIPCYGQSLAINSSAGTSTYDYIEPLAVNTSLSPSNTQDMCAGTAEGFRNAAAKYNVEIPNNFKIIHSVNGTGGTSVAGLSKGTSQYTALINSISTAYNNTIAQGLTFNVPCLTYTQGEEDMRAGGVAANYGTGNFDPFTYKDRLKQLIDDVNIDVKNITGQENDVVFICYQVASHTSYYRYPRIAIQQLELASEYNRMVFAKAMYDVQYVADMVHCPAKTYRNMGNLYGVAAFKSSVLHQNVKSFRPINHYELGNKVQIVFDVPEGSLKFDTTLIPQLPDNNYGFNIYNVNEQSGAAGTIEKSTTEITNVELLNSNTVELTLNKTLEVGDTITYGINGDYWQNIAGSLVVSTGGEGVDGDPKSGAILGGSRGCLRDSLEFKISSDTDIYQTLYNFAPIFEIKK